MSENFDCVACGKCCFSQRRDYVQVFSPDAERLGPARVAKYVAEPVGVIEATPGRPAEPRRFMRMEDGHCAALQISGDGRFTCAVYEDRPVLCHALQPGSSPCLEARKTLGAGLRHP